MTTQYLKEPSFFLLAVAPQSIGCRAAIYSDCVRRIRNQKPSQIR